MKSLAIFTCKLSPMMLINKHKKQRQIIITGPMFNIEMGSNKIEQIR